MPKKKTQNEFIDICSKIHNNYYDYSLVEYKNSQKPIIIICPKHGQFETLPSIHIQGCKCPKCNIENKRIDINKTISLFKEIHRDKYDYSLCNFKNLNEKIKIICPIHGVFEQIAFSHKNGNGCRKCSSFKLKYTTEEFINICKKIHNNKYNYDKTIYESSLSKIIINCPTHGDFLQKACSHLTGYGCTKCVNYNTLKKEHYCKTRNFAYLYIIHIKEENFYKIGITNTSVQKRFKNVLPYEYQEIYIKKSSCECIWDLEKKLHKKFKIFKYTPLKHFDGYTECFKNINIKKILKILE